jgi:hypothetical protein
MNWIHLAQDEEQRQALVNTLMNLWVPQNAGNVCGYATPGFSRSQVH